MRRAALGLVAAVSVAACGGGGNGGNRARYVRAGNAICARYAKDIAKLGKPTTLGDIAPYITKAMPIVSRAVGEIAKLDPPSELRDAYETFRDAAQQTLDRATKLRNAADAGDGEEVRSLLREATAASKRRAGLARGAGLKACAKL